MKIIYLVFLNGIFHACTHTHNTHTHTHTHAHTHTQRKKKPPIFISQDISFNLDIIRIFIAKPWHFSLCLIKEYTLVMSLKLILTGWPTAFHHEDYSPELGS